MPHIHKQYPMRYSVKASTVSCVFVVSIEEVTLELKLKDEQIWQLKEDLVSRSNELHDTTDVSLQQPSPLLLLLLLLLISV